MQKATHILVVGVVDIVELLTIKDHLKMTVAANYEEATELMQKQTFSHVITDAAGEENMSGLDILRVAATKNVPPSTIVCHKDKTCSADGRIWRIETSLNVHFDFADFYQGTVKEYLMHFLQLQRQCA